MFFKRIMIIELGIIMFILIGSAGLIKPSAFAAVDERKTQLIAEAKKEGELLYYAALNIDDATVIANKFKEQYPFIDVKIYRANNNELLTRSLSENRAKRYWLLTCSL